MTVPERFTTERLSIRRVHPSDAPSVFERWAQDAEVTRFLSWTPHQRPEETKAFLSFCRSEWEQGM